MRSRNNVFIFYFLGSLFWTAPVTAAQTRVILPIIIDDKLMGDLQSWVDPKAPERLEVETDRTLKLLSSHVDGAGLETLKAKARISIEELRARGLIAEFDDKALELRIQIPARLRRTQVTSFTRSWTPEDEGDVARPEWVTGFVNINAGEDYVTGNATLPRGRQNVKVETDGAIQLHKFVLEANASGTEGSSDSFKRGDVRLVRDDPERMIRYQAGDLAYTVQGFQDLVPMGGIAATTQFGLQPYRLVMPAGRHEILLSRRSRVRVWVNGRFIQSLDLDAGRHDLRDFPFADGLNRVRLEITDATGRSETLELPFTYSEQLLAPGLHQFTYAAGLPSEGPGQSRTYNTKKPTLTASHRYGFNDRVTAGANVQANDQRLVLGAGPTLGSKIGIFSAQAALSETLTDKTLGAAGRVGYLYVDYSGPFDSQRNLGIEIEARGPRFASLTTQTTAGMTAVEGRISGSQQIANWFTLGLSYGRTNLNNYTINASAARHWANGFDTTLTYSDARDRIGTRQWSATALVSWSLPEKNLDFNAFHNTQDRASRLQWNYHPASSVGGAQVEGGVEQSDLSHGFDTRADYLGNRGRISLAHESDFFKSSGRVTGETHRTGLRAGTAIVYAPSAFAISRPVTDSFAIVKPVEGLAQHEIQLNPQPDGFAEARSGFLGGAVIPNLVSYRRYQLHIAAEDAPIGTPVPRENVTVLPTYKSGVLIRTGEKATLVASGVLLDASRQPLALQSGTAVHKDGGSPVPFFTNREGRFMLEGVTPGQYELHLNDVGRKFRVMVPQADSGWVKVESIAESTNEPTKELP